MFQEIFDHIKESLTISLYTFLKICLILKFSQPFHSFCPAAFHVNEWNILIIHINILLLVVVVLHYYYIIIKYMI